MTRPKQQDISDTLTEFRKLLNDKHLERRLLEVFRRDRAGTTIPDGFRGGEGGPGPVGGHSDPTLTAVQAREKIEFDRHRDHVEHLWGYFHQAFVSLKAAMMRLDGCEELVGHVEDVPSCELCNAAGKRADSAHFSDVGGRLDGLRRLCEWHYTWIYRHDEPPSHERVVAYHDGRQFREKAS